MSERTIQRIKHKFIMTAMLSFAAVMLFMSGAIYFTNLFMTRSEIREVMAYIISNDGYLVDSSDVVDSSSEEEISEDTEEEPAAQVTDDANVMDDTTAQAADAASVADTLAEDANTASGTAITLETVDADAADMATDTGNVSDTDTDSTDMVDTGVVSDTDAGTEDTGADADNSTSSASAASTASSENFLQSVSGPIERPGRGTGNSFRNQLQNLFGLGSNYDSPEFFYSTRYFAVVYDANDEVTNVITQHIAAINRPQAVQYADIVKRNWVTFGSYGDYYYQVSTAEDGSQIVVFLDCTSQLAVSRRILYVCLILIFSGLLLSWLVLRSVANRVVQPEIRNAEMQKSFITNASHELKTPLAVIRANTELQEMMTGENEWTQSTLRQVDRMQGLIQNLVMITRAQEQDNHVELSEVDISKAVTETVKTFAPVASQEGKELVPKIQEGLTMEAEEGQIRQLTSVLIDNAIKYCDDKGTITVVLDKKGRTSIRLAVSNNYAAGKNEDYRRFFDRFYRADQSHNQDKGGYGIGLSIAQNLVEQYHGTIDASWADGVITFTCIL